jgi:succinoglycan biosynthesis transport protein ExoP
LDLDNTPAQGNGHSSTVPGGPGSGPQPAAWQDPSAALHEYVRILVNRRWSILLCFLGVFLSAAVYVYSQPRIYRATAKVQVVQTVQPILLSEQRSGAPQVSLSTQVKYIRSSLTARTACEMAGKKAVPPLTPEEIRHALSVTIEEPDILAISVEHTDPERAALIANVVQDAYIHQNTALARAETTSAKQFLETQMEVVKQDMQRIEAQIRRFKARHNIPDSASQVATTTAPTSGSGVSLVEMQMAVLAAEAELDGLRRLLKSVPPTHRVRRPVEDPVLEGLRQALVEAEVELARAQSRYADTHPRVLAIKDELERLRGLVQERAAQAKVAEVEEPNPLYAALVERVREGEIQVEVQRARAEALAKAEAKKAPSTPGKDPKAFMELVALERAKEIAERTYGQILEQLQQVRLNEAQQQGTARRVDIAQVPEQPVHPTPRRTLAIAALLGLVAGLSLALLQELADTGVRDPDQLLMRTGISSLGFIPATRDTARTAKIAARSPRSPVTESFRTIRSNLKFAHLDSPLHTMMVTSAGAGEGKSFTATNLAIVLAQAGVNTLLVDADLRRPTLHRIFGIPRTPGLTTVLTGETPLREAIQATDVANLYIIPSGPVPPNPAELLESKRMRQLIEEMKEIAEIVIFDTPPALVVTDAVVLSPRMDAMILVIEQGRVTSRAIAEIRRMVEQARGKIAGAVFNKVKSGASGYYYYHYYRYYYYGDHNEGDAQQRRPAMPLTALDHGRNQSQSKGPDEEA